MAKGPKFVEPLTRNSRFHCLPLQGFLNSLLESEAGKKRDERGEERGGGRVLVALKNTG